MHASVIQFVGDVVHRYGLHSKTVLEVGSLDVNGTPREFFNGHYYGIDMRPGPAVDEVRSSHDIPAEWGGFEVVVSTEMLEHDSDPATSLCKMWSVTVDGGILILTARGYDERGCFPVHGYPEDHWRFSVTGLTHLLKQAGWDPLEVFPDPEAPGVFAVARA